MFFKFTKIFLVFMFLISTSLYAQTTENVVIQGSVGKIKAIIHKPASSDNEKIPFVIICHGFSDSKNGKLIVPLANELQKNGFACIRFDFNGHGESDGEQYNMTVVNEIEDAKRVYEYVSKLPYVGKIAMVGHSQGGVVTAMTSAQLGSDKICATALLAPAAVLRDNLLVGYVFGNTFDPLNPPEKFIIPHIPYTLGKNYIVSGQSLPIYETARTYEGQTLIIHGKTDIIVPYTYGKRFYDEIKHSHLKIIEDCNHAFSGHEAEVSALVTEYFKKELY